MPYADKEEGLKHRREYQKTRVGKAAHLRANQAYRNRNRPKRLAHNAVNQAIRRGKMKPWPVCIVPECIETNVHGHHADYGNRLGVTWLCDLHHKEVHRMTKR